jgi:hypothetical protein
MSSTTVEMGELFSVAGPIYVSVGEGMFAYEATTEGAILGGPRRHRRRHHGSDMGTRAPGRRGARKAVSLWRRCLHRGHRRDVGRAHNEEKAEGFSEPKELEGLVVMGQVSVRGKATRRNGLRFGTIFAYRAVEDEIET